MIEEKFKGKKKNYFISSFNKIKYLKGKNIKIASVI